MIKRQYIFSCQVSHNNGTGDKEYWNTVMTHAGWIKPKAATLITNFREMAVEQLQERVDRRITESDIQVLVLNRI